MKENKCYCGHTIYCDCGPEMLEETLEEAIERLYGAGYETLTKEQRMMRFCRLEGFMDGSDWQKQNNYSEEEVLHLLDSLWDRLDIWYNEKVDREFNLIDWFNNCELKKK